MCNESKNRMIYDCRMFNVGVSKMYVQLSEINNSPTVVMRRCSVKCAEFRHVMNAKWSDAHASLGLRTRYKRTRARRDMHTCTRTQACPSKGRHVLACCTVYTYSIRYLHVSNCVHLQSQLQYADIGPTCTSSRHLFRPKQTHPNAHID